MKTLFPVIVCLAAALSATACAEPDQNWHMMQAKNTSEASVFFAEQTKDDLETCKNSNQQLQAVLRDLEAALEGTEGAADQCEIAAMKIGIKSDLKK